MNKKGFTLIELLVILAVMAIAGVASLVLFSTSNENADKEELKNKYMEIQKAAVVYVDLNNSWLSSFTSGNEIYVKLGELQNTNYLSRNINNPVTGEKFPGSYLIKIFKTTFDGNESTSFIDTCIISREGENTRCIADSDGNSCECCENCKCCGL